MDHNQSHNQSGEETRMTAMELRQKKLFELRLKMNEGRKANKEQMSEEHKRMTSAKKTSKPSMETEDTEEQKPPRRKAATKEGQDPYVHDTVEVAKMKAKKKEKKDKHKASFGWDVFNQDALYNAYKKRLDKLPTQTQTSASAASGSGSNKSGAESSSMTTTLTTVATAAAAERVESTLNYGKNDTVSHEGLDRMVAELKDREEKRKKFSRRRQVYEDQDVDFINERNRHFNKRIARAFDKYTVEIRQNIERGTAL